MKVGVLALQGAFIEHEKMLSRFGISCVELRQASDLNRSCDGLILPGGESTVQGKLLHDLHMFQPLKEQITSGIPVLATCAGAILLASEIENDPTVYFGTIPMKIKRNAYGRQLGSFHWTAEVAHIGEVPMTFIRAPYIVSTSDDVEVLARVDKKIVGVQYGRQLAFSFHPELDRHTGIHQMFVHLL